jgi:hypothetical protein
MTVLKQPYIPALSKLAVVLRSGIAKLVGDTTGDSVLASAETHSASRAAHLFGQALYDDSNLEMDWLWYAANMVTASQRRFCLERALDINPDSELAQHALAKLAAH